MFSKVLPTWPPHRIPAKKTRGRRHSLLQHRVMVYIVYTVQCTVCYHFCLDLVKKICVMSYLNILLSKINNAGIVVDKLLTMTD